MKGHEAVEAFRNLSEHGQDSFIAFLRGWSPAAFHACLENGRRTDEVMAKVRAELDAADRGETR